MDRNTIAGFAAVSLPGRALCKLRILSFLQNVLVLQTRIDCKYRQKDFLVKKKKCMLRTYTIFFTDIAVYNNKIFSNNN